MADDKKPLDPQKTVCVVRHKGKEVGRVAASARNATEYINALGREYGDLNVEYVEDETYAMVDRLVRGRRVP